MGFPGVVLSHALETAAGELLPVFPVIQHLFDASGNVLRIEGVNKHAVLAVPDNVPWTAIFGSDDRQPAGSRLDQRQAKWLGQRRINKYATRCAGQPIDDRYFVGAVVFGVGDPAVEIIAVNLHQQLGYYLLGTPVQICDVVAVTRHNDQVGRFLQVGILPVSSNQCADVLACIWARKCEDDRLLGFFQEAGDLSGDLGLQFPSFGGVEPGEIGSGRDDLHLFRLVKIVKLVLFFDFLVGAGDYPFR